MLLHAVRFLAIGFRTYMQTPVAGAPRLCLGATVGEVVGPADPTIVFRLQSLVDERFWDVRSATSLVLVALGLASPFSFHDG